MNNSIFVIKPYKWNGMWVFDDERVGLDISPAMIEIARRRVPEAEFHVQSFLQFRLPTCRAVTALGEVFNYLFDENNSLDSLRRLFAEVFDGVCAARYLRIRHQQTFEAMKR